MNAAAFHLLNDFQRDFPLCARPFARIGQRVGLSETQVLDEYVHLRHEGKIGRIGPVFAPHCFGASTLAAMRVPPAELEATAARVDAFAAVNHDYEREHRWNLWFVVTAADRTRLVATLNDISASAGRPLISLPIVRAFHVDLGFPLDGARGDARPPRAPSTVTTSARERRLVAALQDGLPLEPRPFARVAERADMSEEDTVIQLARWLHSGAVRRVGVVVRHRAVGYVANAMLVFDAPDDAAARIGEALAADGEVSLCYLRRRAAPHWPYNLFCMIHGHARDEVAAGIERLRERHGIAHLRHEILFSRRCFKQTGARYV
ncbi:MAG: Lrp/AsnC family transcriptional regulator [Azoarcus sp.]|jgi:DNA-binding Lrp family transcriptional regulator|nr:Lrp/AsnC family transcriptional regulator [Azoarcus sp.]